MGQVEYVERARRIIQEIKYVTIGTASVNGQPWNTPVYSAFDSDYNFFWASDRLGQHSVNIRENPRVFLAIYDSTVPEGTGRGVYVQAVARELDDLDEVRHALAHLDERAGKAPHTPEKFLGEMPRQIYRATPEAMWVNDNGKRDGHFIDIRIPIGLPLRRETA